MTEYRIEVTERRFGKELVPWEYWVHEENAPLHQYRVMSEAEAVFLQTLLNSATEEQRNAATKEAARLTNAD